MNIAFLIQARLGSTRLPGKILKPFFQEKSILDLLIEKLRSVPDTNIILATSTSSTDNQLEVFAKDKNIDLFRGSESDVLERFIKAAEQFKAKQLIRVCSDNPFLELKSIKELILYVKENPEYDYVSFNVNGTPSIKTHYGFWTEYVTLDTLHKVSNFTNEPLYHEHVTNYIYTHPEKFKIKLLETSKELIKHNNIRLTIDTETDFQNAQTIYKELKRTINYPTIDDIINYLDNHPQYYQIMKQEISKNSK